MSSNTILLVDDDPFILNLYRKQLERAGFQTMSASDGMEVIEMLPSLSVGLIILDLMLPKVDGLEVLEAIRADRRHQHSPVVILSNAYLPQIARNAMKAGANEGLLKSECTPAKLIGIVRRLLGVAGTDDAEQADGLRGLPGATNPEASASPEFTPESDDTDTDYLVASRKALLDKWQPPVARIREHCLNYIKFSRSEQAREYLERVYRSVRLLGSRASVAGCTKVVQLTGTLEAMLFERLCKDADVSPSWTESLAQAVECLNHLFSTGKTGSAEAPRKPRVILVDDDSVCNRANEMVLQRVNYETVSTTDGISALALMEQSSFDLILLDIDMPGMSGFDVCEKLRRIPGYQSTPVIFVTLYGDFQNLALSILSGGNGLISKPISPLEMILKATIHLLHNSEVTAADTESSATRPVSPAPATGRANPHGSSLTTVGKEPVLPGRSTQEAAA